MSMHTWRHRHDWVYPLCVTYLELRAWSFQSYKGGCPGISPCLPLPRSRFVLLWCCVQRDNKITCSQRCGAGADGFVNFRTRTVQVSAGPCVTFHLLIGRPPKQSHNSFQMALPKLQVWSCLCVNMWCCNVRCWGGAQGERANTISG